MWSLQIESHIADFLFVARFYWPEISFSLKQGHYNYIPEFRLSLMSPGYLIWNWQTDLLTEVVLLLECCSSRWKYITSLAHLFWVPTFSWFVIHSESSACVFLLPLNKCWICILVSFNLLLINWFAWLYVHSNWDIYKLESGHKIHKLELHVMSTCTQGKSFEHLPVKLSNKFTRKVQLLGVLQ